MRRWAIAAAALLLLGVAVYLLAAPRGRDRRSGDDAPAADAGSTPGGPGGVAARDDPDSAAATVRGQVVDEDGQPVDGGVLVLSCPGKSIAIEEDGTFEGLACRGRICAELNHPYLLPAEPWVLAVGVDNTLQARSAARLHGEVRSRGEPVAAATITFLPPDEADPTAAIPFRTRSTTTDEDGAWSVAFIERPPCSPCSEVCPDPPVLHDALQVVVTATGHAALTVPWSTDEPPADPWILELPAAGDLLTGRLVDVEGDAYARAYVLGRSVDRPHEQRRADVDPDGNFELDGLGEGAYALRALQDGVELAVGEGVAGDDVELHGSKSARGPTLVVQVRRGTKPIAGAVVDGGPFRAERTDMKGQVSAARVLAGSIALRVRAPGAAAVRREITIEDQSDDLVHEVVELPSS